MKLARLYMMVVIIATAMTVALSGCKKIADESGAIAFNAKSGRLAELPAGYEGGEAVFSSSGGSVAIAAKSAGKVTVFRNSIPVGTYDAARELLFAEGGNELAFAAQKGGTEVVVANGIEGEPFEAVSDLFYVAKSPVVYAAQRSGKMYVVAGKKLSAPFDRSVPTPTISSDGRQLAYVEWQEATKKGSLRVCTVDMEECRSGTQYDSVATLKGNSARTRAVYIAGKDGKKSVISFDFRQSGQAEKASGWYDDVVTVNLSDNGEHIAFIARRGDSFLLVKDNQEQPLEMFETSFDFRVANNGKVIHAALMKGKVRCYVDGRQIGKPYDSVDSPTLSADGGHSLFAAQDGEKYVVVVDGVAGPSFDMVVTPQFTPDGSRIIYRVRDKGERFVVIADLQGKTLREHQHYESVWNVTVAPDGKTVGYGVRNGQEYLWKVEKL